VLQACGLHQCQHLSNKQTHATHLRAVGRRVAEASVSARSVHVIGATHASSAAAGASRLLHDLFFTPSTAARSKCDFVIFCARLPEAKERARATQRGREVRLIRVSFSKSSARGGGVGCAQLRARRLSASVPGQRNDDAAFLQVHVSALAINSVSTTALRAQSYQQRFTSSVLCLGYTIAVSHSTLENNVNTVICRLCTVRARRPEHQYQQA
jgi:hypothetical protein